MKVTLNDQLGPKGRSTIFVDGRQVGYYRPATKQVQFAPAHVSDELKAFVIEELEAAGLTAASVTNPPELPPEEEAAIEEALAEAAAS